MANKFYLAKWVEDSTREHSKWESYHTGIYGGL